MKHDISFTETPMRYARYERIAEATGIVWSRRALVLAPLPRPSDVLVSALCDQDHLRAASRHDLRKRAAELAGGPVRLSRIRRCYNDRILVTFTRNGMRPVAQQAPVQ